MPTILALLLLAGGCAKSGGGTTGPEAVAVVTSCSIPIPLAVTLTTSLEYAVMNGQSQLLDIAAPDVPGPYPLIVLIHGGGWKSGDRADLRSQAQTLAGEGYVVADVNYRLTAPGVNTFPAAVEDVRCAVRTLVANAAMIGFDPSKLVAYGGSAGGHLAAMLGTAADVPGLDGACPLSGPMPRFKGVVALAPPTDLRDLALFGNNPVIDPPTTVTNFLGGAPSAVPATAALASPIVHVDASDPPFLLFQGLLDDVILPVQTRNFRDALWERGVPATLFEANVGHEAPAPGSPDAVTLACTTLAFLKTVVP